MKPQTFTVHLIERLDCSISDAIQILAFDAQEAAQKVAYPEFEQGAILSPSEEWKQTGCTAFEWRYQDGCCSAYIYSVLDPELTNQGGA